RPENRGSFNLTQEGAPDDRDQHCQSAASAYDRRHGRAQAQPAHTAQPYLWHCQSKFYTACSRPRAGWSSTVFAHELPPRLAGFHAENRLYLFALTVPLQRGAERQPAGEEFLVQIGQKQPAEETRQDPNREEEARPAGDPSRAVGRETSTRDNAVQMWVVQE